MGKIDDALLQRWLFRVRRNYVQPEVCFYKKCISSLRQLSQKFQAMIVKLL